MGFNDEVYSYMKGAKAFILSSLWEDPGFVLIESALVIFLYYQVIAKTDQVNFYKMVKVDYCILVIKKMS